MDRNLQPRGIAAPNPTGWRTGNTGSRSTPNSGPAFAAWELIGLPTSASNASNFGSPKANSNRLACLFAGPANSRWRRPSPSARPRRGAQRPRLPSARIAPGRANRPRPAQAKTRARSRERLGGLASGGRLASLLRAVRGGRIATIRPLRRLCPAGCFGPHRPAPPQAMADSVGGI
jgi:hypothetical protein